MIKSVLWNTALICLMTQPALAQVSNYPENPVDKGEY